MVEIIQKLPYWVHIEVLIFGGQKLSMLNKLNDQFTPCGIFFWQLNREIFCEIWKNDSKIVIFAPIQSFFRP